MAAPDPAPLRLAVADAAFRLTAAERAKIAPGFDPDALERLLAHIRPDLRPEILSYFDAGGGRGQLIEIHDPHLQAVLEEVWAPMWEDASERALDEGWFNMPGREIAKARRDKRRPEPPPGPPAG